MFEQVATPFAKLMYYRFKGFFRQIKVQEGLGIPSLYSRRFNSSWDEDGVA
jgi:hypothetical protein